MAKRELKMHLKRDDSDVLSDYSARCGIITENSTDDPEAITCQHCSGFYRTNLEWYSQVKNGALVNRGQTGEGDLYTRSDVEAGLKRLGWSDAAIMQILMNTKIFRDTLLPGDSVDPWQEQFMGVRVHPGGPVSNRAQR